MKEIQNFWIFGLHDMQFFQCILKRVMHFKFKFQKIKEKLKINKNKKLGTTKTKKFLKFFEFYHILGHEKKDFSKNCCWVDIVFTPQNQREMKD